MWRVLNARNSLTDKLDQSEHSNMILMMAIMRQLMRKVPASAGPCLSRALPNVYKYNIVYI